MGKVILGAWSGIVVIAVDGIFKVFMVMVMVMSSISIIRRAMGKVILGAA